MASESQPIIKNRYCGSKHAHDPHEQPMIGLRPEDTLIMYACRGKA